MARVPCRAVLSLMILAALAGRAAAATLTVVNANDSGTGSLRAAFASATSGDTIAFASSLAGATIHLTSTDTTQGLDAPFGPTALVVNGRDLTIDGSGAPGLTIDVGATRQRIFAVTGLGGSGAVPPATQGVLRIRDLTLAGGVAQGGDGGSGSASFTGGGGGAAGPGGAAFVDAGSKLVLSGVLVKGCTAQGGAGGVSALLVASTGGGGGGLEAAGSAPQGGAPNGGGVGSNGGFGGGGGGGAFGAGGSGGRFGGGGGGGTSYPSNAGGTGFGGGGGGGGGFLSTGGLGLDGGGKGGDDAGDGGGGAGLGGGVFVNGGSLEATNTTWTSCVAAGSAVGGLPRAGSGLGGAIYALNGTVTLAFCTLAGNTANTGGALAVSGTSVTIQSSILRDGATGTSGATASGGSNVIESQSGFTPALGTIAGNGDPLLAPLASNGGPTQTLALGAGSPARDAGDWTLTGTPAPIGAGGVDQRGFKRRQGVTDVGAYETQPSAVSVVSGGGQSARVGTTFGVAIVISATDPFGAALQGYSVTLTPPSSGASASFLPSPLVTNASGLATATATASSTAGSYGVALVGSSSSFSLTNTAGPPASLTVVSGGGQRAGVGAAFAQPIVLEVKDSSGNLAGGVTVTLSAPASGASASFAVAGTTGSDGRVSATATANTTGGTYAVSATAGSATASFQLTNVVPASAPALSGGGQSVAVGSAFGAPIVIEVRDASGNPIAGVTVTLTAPTSGPSATFSPANLVTDLAGRVSATATANGEAGGPYTVTITAGSATSTFQLTNLPATTGSGGHHGSSGCALGGGAGGSPLCGAPLLLALAGLVVRRRHRGA